MSFQIAKNLIVFSFLFLFSHLVFAQTPTNLELNRPIEREIKGGETHFFQIDLPTGQYVKIETVERGVEISISVKDPIGKSFLEFSVPYTDKDPQSMNFVTKEAGKYLISIAPDALNSVAGKYQLNLIESRPADEKDIQLFNVLQLTLFAKALRNGGKFDEAIAIAEKALAILKQFGGEENAETANLLSEIGSSYDDKSNIQKAEENYSKSLEIYERIYGQNHPYVATVLGNLGVVFRRNGNYDKAELYFTRALEINEKIFGKDHLIVSQNLSNLGANYYSKGEYTKAEECHRRALVIREAQLGSNNTAVAISINNIAVVYRMQGDYPRTLEMLKRSLSILEKNLPADDLSLAAIVSNIAGVSFELGDFVAAEKYFERSIAIREKKLGSESPDLANTLTGLGSYYESRGEYEKAEVQYLRCLHNYEKAYGKEHPDYARALANVSAIYRVRGEYDKAEPMQLQALEIFQKKLGSENSSVAAALNNIGLIASYKKDFEKSEKYYLQSLAMFEKINGEFFPLTGRVIKNLVTLYIEKQDFEKAISYQKRLLVIHEKLLEINLSIGSERQKKTYLETLNSDLQNMLALQADLLPNSDEIKNLTLKLILERKGRTSDVLASNLSVLRQTANPIDQQAIDRLSDLRSRLSNFVISGSGSQKPEIYKAKLKDLVETKDILESQLSERSATYRSARQPISIDSIASTIPKNSVLVEFIVDNPIDRTSNSPKPKFLPQRYIAFTLNQKGIIQSKIIGDKKLIDEAIAKFREALQDPKRTDIKQLARDLDKKVMSPIREFLGDSRQLLISPDGNLNLIPFEALVDENGKYLVEKYSISYLSSGRDLLRMQNSKPNNNSPLIIANPDFGIAETTAKVENQTVAKRDKKRGVTVAKSLSETYFAPLSGTEQEGKTIQTLFPESTLLTGTKATKDALKQTKSPKILHIASHGFYLEDKEKTDSENPLLRSGIALAGANAHKENNGILTALESSGLNLFGTKLVVLSACGTGLGEVQSGEGVFGLRRSFVLAGSESLVISLWSVSDYVTRELMTNYYKNLKQGIGRGESLRRVQLEMLKNPKRNHPFYWASFIESGNWTSL